jgi:hypothetical protein
MADRLIRLRLGLELGPSPPCSWEQLAMDRS